MIRVTHSLCALFRLRALAPLVLCVMSAGTVGLFAQESAPENPPAQSEAESPAPAQKEPAAPTPAPAGTAPSEYAPAPAPPAREESAPPVRAEPEPETVAPVRETTPAPRERRTAPAARKPVAAEPAPAQAAEIESPASAPAPIPVAQGMADELPDFDRELLPGYEKLQNPPREFPHLLDEGAGTPAPAPGDESNGGQTAGDVEDGQGQDEGPGWFSRLYDSIWADRTVRNGMIVIALILIFIVFRLRNGRGRKGYM